MKCNSLALTQHTPGHAKIESKYNHEHAIVGSDGYALCTTTNVLIDGSGGHKETDSIIRTPEVQAANARRLAACWNACIGVSTEWLEDSKTIVLLAEPVSERFKALESANRTMLDVLAERQQELMRDNGTVDPDTGTWEGPEWVDMVVEEIEILIERLRAAVTSLKGGAA